MAFSVFRLPKEPLNLMFIVVNSDKMSIVVDSDKMSIVVDSDKISMVVVNDKLEKTNNRSLDLMVLISDKRE